MKLDNSGEWVADAHRRQNSPDDYAQESWELAFLSELRWPARVTLALALAWLLLGVRGTAPRETRAAGPWAETRFTTGCSPQPYAPYEGGDPPIWSPPEPPDAPETVGLTVNLGSFVNHQPLLGAGFNFENALWSCLPYRAVLQTDLLDAFKPSIARVDTGLLPAAPPDMPASQLGPAVYRSVLRSPQYAESWDFFRQLHQNGVRIVLGVWGGPAQFTDDGTRLGTLLPQHYNDYVDYLVTLVDLITREERIPIWAITIANEPDGGDGNRISPQGLAQIAHLLGPRLDPYGVKLYGPDTGSAENALRYLPDLLADPVIVSRLAFVGFHQYAADTTVRQVVDEVHRYHPELPVIITEYTSFAFGDLDAGQETVDHLGFSLDVVDTLLAHYANGADAALYWDAVDYLQPGHNAITRWGLLRGPSQEFRRRLWYYALLQVLQYIKPGTRLLDIGQVGGPDVRTLAVRTPDGGLAIFLDNQGTGGTDIDLRLENGSLTQAAALNITRTGHRTHAVEAGVVTQQEGHYAVHLPASSLTTLSVASPLAPSYVGPANPSP